MLGSKYAQHILVEKPLMKYKIEKNQGFTLIELMIVVAIISILTAVSLPAYRSYVLKADRIFAIQMLEEVAIRQERYRLQRNIYASTLNQLGYSPTGSLLDVTNSNTDVIYQLTMPANIVTDASGQKFELTLTAVNAQAQDRCAEFTLDNRRIKGAKSNTGDTSDDTVAECW